MSTTTEQDRFASLELIQTTAEICGKCKFWRPSRRHESYVWYESVSFTGPRFPEVGQCRRNPPAVCPPIPVREDEDCAGPAYNTMLDGAGGLVDSDGVPGPIHAVGVWPLTSVRDWCGEFKAASNESLGLASVHHVP